MTISQSISLSLSLRLCTCLFFGLDNRTHKFVQSPLYINRLQVLLLRRAASCLSPLRCVSGSLSGKKNKNTLTYLTFKDLTHRHTHTVIIHNMRQPAKGHSKFGGEGAKLQKHAHKSSLQRHRSPGKSGTQKKNL